MSDETFDLQSFLPYLLNQAADTTGLEFQRHYKAKYGMLRTEWRVLFHLGRYGEMPAKEICARARVHKTKVSRAVVALEQKRYVEREELESDRRHETLRLTRQGRSVFTDLYQAAQEFDAKLREKMTPEESVVLYKALRRLAEL